LMFILGHREDETSFALNRARDALLESGRHFTDLTDEDFRQIMPHMTSETFYRLYGDYGSTSESRWIRDPELLDMVLNDLRHFHLLFHSDDIVAKRREDAKAAPIATSGPAARMAGA
jgi:hypothetical protein